jgi:DNA-binding transcriptional LysR family regulator
MHGNRNDLVTFVTVAREHCFTRVAARGPFQPAVSHAAGLRLLTRVSSTQTAERLLQTVSPRFEEIEAGLNGHN